MSISFEIGEDGKLQISIGEETSIRTVREGKGKSLIDLPEEYVVVDIETTGLSPEYDDIIEIAAVKYCNGIKGDIFSTLVNPLYEIDAYITTLTGITNEMLKDAPSIADCIGEFKEFIGDRIIVGYNVNFDINFLYDNLLKCTGQMLSNDFVDVMRIARKLLPELRHHRQVDISEHYNISTEGSHRAEKDCLICEACFEELKNELINKGISKDEFVKLYSSKGISAKNISTENTEFDEEHALYGKVCVFTGTLEKNAEKRCDANSC